MLLTSIDDTYSIVTSLDDYEKSFECILLERETSFFYENATKFLKEDFEKNKEAFNDFINLIARLHFRVKETYISVVTEPIRTEAQIKQAKDDLLQLEADLSSIKPLYERLVEMKKR